MCNRVLTIEREGRLREDFRMQVTRLILERIEREGIAENAMPHLRETGCDRVRTRLAEAGV